MGETDVETKNHSVQYIVSKGDMRRGAICAWDVLEMANREGDGSFPTRENIPVCEPMSVSIMACLSIIVCGSKMFLHSSSHVLIYECASCQCPGYKRESVWICIHHSRIRPAMV